MKIEKLSQLKDGDRVRVKLTTPKESTVIDAVITIEDDCVYACQDVLDGESCRDRKGYICSWYLGDFDGNFKDYDWIEIDQPAEQAASPQPKANPFFEYSTVPLSVAMFKMGDDPLRATTLSIKRNMDGKVVVVADFGELNAKVVVCPEDFEAIAKAARDLLKKYDDCDLSKW